MTDKRSPQSPAYRSQKRSKTFPLAPDEEEINTPCRRATAPLAENTSVPEDSTSSKQASAENETSTPDEEEDGNFEDIPLSASLPSKNPDADPQSPGLRKPDTRAARRDVDDEPLENNGGGLHTSKGEESDSSSEGWFPPDYDDDESESGSFVHIENLDEELGRWTAPQEPLRPDNPYRKGKIIEIRRHSAPRPFGMNYSYYEGVREPASERELRLTTLVELCLDRPPIGGETVADEEAQTLEIKDEIRVKDDGGAQIVVCRFSGEKQEVVAKIYDPLYYGFADRMWSDRPRDVTYEADKDYAREVAAYSELDSQLGGTDIPKYHGSWTFQMPLDLPAGQKTRNIRLILIEHIKGKPMMDLKPESFSESTRMELITRMVEVVSRIQFAGVRHGDISQRNVMVCIAEPEVVERVAMIDFNFAAATGLDNFQEQFGGSRRQPKPDKPPNPIDRWWGGALYGVAGEWLPKGWELRLRALQEWLYERYGDSEEYEPPKRRLNWDEENLPRNWIAT
ncbi:hypothetical protein INS49_004591 [Diaporthe citri]|uniref:uncharacterized protein n=1 Tax=Diaporthe citri TaxID=83186 RepID=UPI001C7E465C|nr:uncharacterized protein INS49_004591 [Diaporthe citri]KAG6354573.1 hypothetical protein INS49_004591 [Diaporthe citri]